MTIMQLDMTFPTNKRQTFMISMLCSKTHMIRSNRRIVSRRRQTQGIVREMTEVAVDMVEVEIGNRRLQGKVVVIAICYRKT